MKVAIVGSGLVGSSWATIFASAGYDVQMYDISEKQLEIARNNVATNLRKLEENGLQRGTISAEQALANVSTTVSLEEAMNGAGYMQESAVENLEFRQTFWKQLDQLAGPETILACSTSTIPASKFTEGLKNRERCLIVHPVNPPLFLPLTELVPAPWTSQSTVDRAAEILESVRQKPVKLRKEVDGFAVNRLQYALLAETWRLVADGVLSAEDVDAVMSHGLGPRYAFRGPLATTHLNAFGVKDYFQRYSGAIQTVTATFGPMPTFDDPAVIESIASELDQTMPTERIREFQAERERHLIEMAKLKRQLE